MKGTQDFGLKYTKVEDLKIIGYTDSDFDGGKETRVSTYGDKISIETTTVS